MTVTFDPDYPREGVALFSAFIKMADGIDLNVVLDIAANFLIASLTMEGDAHGLDRDSRIARAQEVAAGIASGVVYQLDRVPQPTDVVVDDGPGVTHA
jgi:hypothetical protein